jgi:hypothetical protein
MFVDTLSPTTQRNLAQIARTALVEDADVDPMPSVLVPLDWTEVKQFFEREVKRLVEELL